MNDPGSDAQDVELGLVKEGTRSSLMGESKQGLEEKMNNDFRGELLKRHQSISKILTDLVSDEGKGKKGKKIKLTFEDVRVQIGGQELLKGIRGEARPGQVLSIMGPSGSGKTTLLNSLAGRQKLSGGRIFLNDHRQIKAMKRYIAYVLQDEVFFGVMTVQQVMYFTAMIRLPDTMSEKEKMERADAVMELLEIKKCAHSIVGTPFQRGISGGERKRLNVGVQLITWPSLILLDEPTSGLDSSTSYDLILTLRELARQGCTIVTTIHQPSSAVFQLFDKLLVLAEGQTFYSGDADKVVGHFESLGYRCPANYNPGDFVLELAKSKVALKNIFGGSKAISSPGPSSMNTMEVITEGKSEASGSVPSRAAAAAADRKSSLSPPSKGDASWEDAFPSSWWTQFKALFHRAWLVKQSQSLDNLQMIQVACLTVVVSLVWFQMDAKEDSIQDRFGLVFFTVIFWTFFPMFQAVATFPPERAVLLRERAQGAYRLSAYYLAKMLAETPLNIINPSAFVIVTYWMTDLHDSVGTFFLYWLLLLINVEFASSTGMLVSASQTSPKKALVTVSTLVLTSMLLGGFYVNPDNIPIWLRWVRWLSFVTYSFGSMVTQVFDGGLRFSCGAESQYDACETRDYISGTDVLDNRGITDIPVVYALVLFFSTVIVKFATYVVLFYRYKPKTPL
uniref:ABC transporter domain-containing protein n=1 Tax=Lotharella oceanica TaxID=641309 RepID=A0A7S2TIU1_9EUKA|mmetsp:Transcript_16125/g.30601  ORF Transcript_16125/g.30601 Transcript_16125/m.30601 type:complete len:678 (+) Transcript_16125:155-2188(+)